MLTEKEFVLDTLRRAGKSAAVNLQAESPSMTGTELYAAEEYIPDFQAARAAKKHAGAQGRPERWLYLPVHRRAGGSSSPGLRQ